MNEEDPEIEVSVGPNGLTLTVGDNASGFEVNTIESVLDYTIRVSSREAYVAPTRGAQGNALKTILAMGYVRKETGVLGTVLECGGEKATVVKLPLAL